MIVLFVNKGTFFHFFGCIFVCHELNSNVTDYENLNYIFFMSLFSLPLMLNAQSVDEMLQKCVCRY